jgi:tRNA(Ile)-lysidine synthase TilS/MesJ
MVIFMMINSAAKTVQLYNMIAQGDVIYVGLSGGADSVCCFCVCWRCPKNTTLRLELSI